MNDIYKCYKTVIEMLVDRKIAVPIVYTNMSKEDFILQLNEGDYFDINVENTYVRFIYDKDLDKPKPIKQIKQSIVKVVRDVTNIGYDKCIIIMYKPQWNITLIEKFNKINIPNCNVFYYKYLLFNFSKNILVPKHEKLSLEEKQLQNTIVSNKINLGVISITDPIVKYYGYEIDDIVKITRNKNNSSSVFYRLVKNTEFNEDNQIVEQDSTTIPEQPEGILFDGYNDEAWQARRTKEREVRAATRDAARARAATREAARAAEAVAKSYKAVLSNNIYINQSTIEVQKYPIIPGKELFHGIKFSIVEDDYDHYLNYFPILNSGYNFIDIIKQNHKIFEYNINNTFNNLDLKKIDKDFEVPGVNNELILIDDIDNCNNFTEVIKQLAIGQGIGNIETNNPLYLKPISDLLKSKFIHFKDDTIQDDSYKCTPLYQRITLYLFEDKPDFVILCMPRIMNNSSTLKYTFKDSNVRLESTIRINGQNYRLESLSYHDGFDRPMKNVGGHYSNFVRSSNDMELTSYNFHHISDSNSTVGKVDPTIKFGNWTIAAYVKVELEPEPESELEPDGDTVAQFYPKLLYNSNNFCFVNSILQILYSINSIKDKLLQVTESERELSDSYHSIHDKFTAWRASDTKTKIPKSTILWNGTQIVIENETNEADDVKISSAIDEEKKELEKLFGINTFNDNFKKLLYGNKIIFLIRQIFIQMNQNNNIDSSNLLFKNSRGGLASIISIDTDSFDIKIIPSETDVFEYYIQQGDNTELIYNILSELENNDKIQNGRVQEQSYDIIPMNSANI